MNRQNRRLMKQEKREAVKAETPHNMTNSQLVGMISDAEKAAYIKGKKDGIRVAVIACMGAYTIAMDASNLGHRTTEIIEAANNEVFRLLGRQDPLTGEYDLDIESIKQYAERCGVKCPEL